MMAFRLGFVGLLLLGPTMADAAEPSNLDPKALSTALRPLLLASLPDPLSVAPQGWGEQREVTIGVRWERAGVLLKPIPMRAVRNDGHWQKVTLTAIDPTKSLSLSIHDIKHREDKTTFRASFGLNVRAVYENQIWKMGKRVYAGETHLRCRASLEMNCELTTTTTLAPGALLPTIKLTVKATEAKSGYSDFVCEHTLGVSGKPAEVMGKAAFEVVKTVAPQVEKDLLAKANQAVLKATDKKEVRVELDKLLAIPTK